MRQAIAAQLVDTKTKAFVQADLVLGVTIDEVDEAVALWSPYLREHEKETGHRPQHAHWDWSKKARAISPVSSYAIVGVMIAGEMQALLLWDEDFVTARHPDQLGHPLLYVHFIATAPWNDRDIVDTPRYIGAGTLLIRTAIERSRDLGYKGRLGLHALSQAEAFYKGKCQMADLGVDTSGAHEGLRCFELTSVLADQFTKQLDEEKRK